MCRPQESLRVGPAAPGRRGFELGCDGFGTSNGFPPNRGIESESASSQQLDYLQTSELHSTSVIKRFLEMTGETTCAPLVAAFWAIDSTHHDCLT